MSINAKQTGAFYSNEILSDDDNSLHLDSDSSSDDDPLSTDAQEKDNSELLEKRIISKIKEIFNENCDPITFKMDMEKFSEKYKNSLSDPIVLMKVFNEIKMHSNRVLKNRHGANISSIPVLQANLDAHESRLFIFKSLLSFCKNAENSNKAYRVIFTDGVLQEYHLISDVINKLKSQINYTKYFLDEKNNSLVINDIVFKGIVYSRELSEAIEQATHDLASTQRIFWPTIQKGLDAAYRHQCALLDVFKIDDIIKAEATSKRLIEFSRRYLPLWGDQEETAAITSQLDKFESLFYEINIKKQEANASSLYLIENYNALSSGYDFEKNHLLYADQSHTIKMTNQMFNQYIKNLQTYDDTLPTVALSDAIYFAQQFVTLQSSTQNKYEHCTALLDAWRGWYQHTLKLGGHYPALSLELLNNYSDIVEKHAKRLHIFTRSDQKIANELLDKPKKTKTKSPIKIASVPVANVPVPVPVPVPVANVLSTSIATKSKKQNKKQKKAKLSKKKKQRVRGKSSVANNIAANVENENVIEIDPKKQQILSAAEVHAVVANQPSELENALIVGQITLPRNIQDFMAFIKSTQLGYQIYGYGQWVTDLLHTNSVGTLCKPCFVTDCNPNVLLNLFPKAKPDFFMDGLWHANAKREDMDFNILFEPNLNLKNFCEKVYLANESLLLKSNGDVLDQLGVYHLINHAKLQPIGDVLTSFKEDPVRILKTIRSAAYLNKLWNKTLELAMTTHALRLSELPIAVIGRQLRLLFTEGSAVTHFDHLYALGLIPAIVPALGSDAYRYLDKNSNTYRYLRNKFSKIDQMSLEARQAIDPIKFLAYFCLPLLNKILLSAHTDDLYISDVELNGAIGKTIDLFMSTYKGHIEEKARLKAKIQGFVDKYWKELNKELLSQRNVHMTPNAAPIVFGYLAHQQQFMNVLPEPTAQLPYEPNYNFVPGVFIYKKP